MSKIDRVSGYALAQVADFYDAAGYGGGVRETDLVLAAYVDGVLAG